MDKKFKKALFIFRRDLRLEDNTGLIFALENAEKVIPCFIFTPQQIENNSYYSAHCLQFMIESLEDLDQQLQEKGTRLSLFFGENEKIIEKCIKELSIDAVVVNRDYTPYSFQRDEEILSLCEKFNLPFHSFDDALLHPPFDTLKKDGTPYTVFTPFYRHASKLSVSECIKNPYTNYFTTPVPFAQDNTLYSKILPHRNHQAKGGRKAAFKILKNIEHFAHYKEERDFPQHNATTHLSAHLKFTTYSIREIYHMLENQFGASCDLIRSLYWRDFFTCIALYFPKVFEGAFREKFNHLPWNNDKEMFKKWCEGKTGFPIIDAGMREMNVTGFMQNRVRMIAASFLVKDLHIDWRWGEKYFAQTLIDYDPAVNNGNWQWAASTGCDAQPYFRIFNPWSQQVKFDAQCHYIKHWIPELSSLSPSIIHQWHLKTAPTSLYPRPIIDHSIESKIALENYKTCR